MKANVLVGIIGCAFLVSLSIPILRAEHGDNDRPGMSDDDDSRVQAGFAYVRGPGITLDFKKKDRKLVGLGSYLVNAVGGCNDCHTAPPFTQDPFDRLGVRPNRSTTTVTWLAVHRFGPPGITGTPVSRDITPWEDGKPAGLSLRQFLHVIKTGEDPDNPGMVLQVMPWPVYQAMNDDDLTAICRRPCSAIPAITANTCQPAERVSAGEKAASLPTRGTTRPFGSVSGGSNPERGHATRHNRLEECMKGAALFVAGVCWCAVNPGKRVSGQYQATPQDSLRGACMCRRQRLWPHGGVETGL